MLRKIVILMTMVLLVGCGSGEEEQKENVTESETVQDIEIEEIEEETDVDDEAEVDVQEEEKETVSVQKMIDDAEAKAAVLEKKLAEDASLTQADMNELSHEIYLVWDNVLNEIWGVLKDTLDEDAMNSLLEEQREWISDKEAEAKKAGEEFAGGSMEALAVNQKAAELTRLRVYELADYLEN